VTHSIELTTTLGLMTALLYWRHRSNVRNIITGREHKIGVKKESG
jgi:glycerol-3-phosphate acyltransferase PlsY